MAPLLAGLGASGGLLSTISTIATIASPLLGVMGAVASNKEAKAQEAEFQRQAKEERLMASVGAERQRRANRQRQSAERTAFIEGGAYSGTALGVLEQNSVAQELDALTVEFQGEQAGRAADFRAEQAGKRSSPLNVFSAAVSGFNQVDPLNIGN